MKKYTGTAVIILLMLVGLGLILYPTLSDYWNSMHQSRLIASYEQDVADMDDDSAEDMWAAAEAYNHTLAEEGIRWKLTEAEVKEYESLLNVTGTGIMGYVEIPKINVSLPIYHGTDEGVLQVAIGHLEGTSLPVGGEGSHSVISGHRGLPSAKLFTDLDAMEEGDRFMLHVLGETLTYEVDQIRIVEPDDVSEIEIEEYQDYCTLVTCTPYGVNSHRLLVRGIRVADESEEQSVSADALLIDPLMTAPVMAIPVLLILGVWALTGRPGKKKKN